MSDEPIAPKQTYETVRLLPVYLSATERADEFIETIADIQENTKKYITAVDEIIASIQSPKVLATSEPKNECCSIC